MTLRVPALLACLALALSCGAGEEADPGAAAPPAAAPAAADPAAAAAPAEPDDLETGLLVAISSFGKGPDGKPLPRSELLFLRREAGEWKATTHVDAEAPVFHKAMIYQPPGAEPGILTLGGSVPAGPAALKLWRGSPMVAETLWDVNFGGKFSRMRDVEIADVHGDGREALVVATHDQGVVAVVSPGEDGWKVEELDRQPGRFVHEIEVGDLDGDGVVEIYATPSDPNKLDGSHQIGEVERYVPAKGEGRTLVADLPALQRHAKEILVDDVDGDGRDELYVSIEAAEGGDLEIRRYDADTDPGAGAVIATLPDPMCRFLVAGDLDGDGEREMVAAAKDTGLWLLRPGDDPRGAWDVSAIDADSKGFEHASLIADLDGDGTDELYVASDDDREIRRYVWQDGKPVRSVIHRRKDPSPLLTWGLAPAPVSLFPEEDD